MKISRLERHYKYITKHSILIFISLTLVALYGVISFKNSPQIQFQIFISLSLAYLTWALLHHIVDKSLNLEVVIEYVLTALLAIVILYGLLI